MKPKKLWGIVFILIAGLLCWSLLSRRDPKTEIFDYVQTNCSELESFAEDILRAEGQIPSTFDRWSVARYRDANMIQFTGLSKGLGSSTVYTGFYFSADGSPKGFQGTEMMYSPNGTGWYWKEEHGDNYAYTEEIIEKWYWFEMHF